MKTARLYHCARCHRQVWICSSCDRGNRYCRNDCPQIARQQSQRQASQKYRSSRKGRLANAERQRRFRQRKNKVTHQGSASLALRDSLSKPFSSSLTCGSAHASDRKTGIYCHLCAVYASLFCDAGFCSPRYEVEPGGKQPFAPGQRLPVGSANLRVGANHS